MSILIKDMKMPESCGDCRFCASLADTEWGTCARCLIDDECREASSKSGCPLVEVPTPHGRLIDADKLEPDSEYDDGDYWAVSMAQIENAPTIIEAEEGENK